MAGDVFKLYIQNIIILNQKLAENKVGKALFYGPRVNDQSNLTFFQNLFRGGSRKSSSGKDHASIVAHAVHQLSQSPAPS